MMLQLRYKTKNGILKTKEIPVSKSVEMLILDINAVTKDFEEVVTDNEPNIIRGEN